MISKVCKKIFMVIFCLCYGSCWLDGNVSCSNLSSDEEIEEMEKRKKEFEKEREKWISNLAPCVDGEVKIGTQVWQKCNLNIKPSTGKSSCYDTGIFSSLVNNSDNCKKFGRLYDWATAMALPDSCNSTSCASQINANHKGLCPSGWHIPSNADWAELISYVNSENDLRMSGCSYNSSDALDTYGFSALPGGCGYEDWFYRLGYHGYWWSSSGGYKKIYCGGDDAMKCDRGYRSSLYSVRCVKDETPEERQAREEMEKERQERKEQERQAKEEKERQEKEAREEKERQERERQEQEMILNLAPPCVDGTVKIGTQVWQKCNLNVEPGTGNSKCYNNYSASCERFGRLYDWATAMALPDSCNSKSCASQINAKHKGLCPSGWHIPSKADWDALESYIESDKGCASCAKYLKVKGWNSDNTEALDSYGFAALPGGYGYSGGSFSNVGKYGCWWVPTENDDDYSDAYSWFMRYNSEYDFVGYFDKDFLYSVRCVKD